MVDVKLPVLTSKSGRTRQCDVVVEEGAEPRITRTLVEVQKRGSKPDETTFDGWLNKMRQIGAQHLVCVTESGFPTSIKERAQELGPTVRLLTLKQLEAGNWPIPPARYSDTMRIVTYERLVQVTYDHYHLVRIDPSKQSEQPDPFAEDLRIQGRLVSASDVMDWHLFGHPKNVAVLPAGQKIRLQVDFEGGLESDLEHLTHDGNWVGLNHLVLVMDLSIEDVDVEWAMHSYSQLDWGDVAWAIRAKATVFGKNMHLAIPLKQQAPGEYSLGRPMAMSDHQMFLAAGDLGLKADQLRDES